MVAEMEETAAEFICMSMVARLLARPAEGLCSRLDVVYEETLWGRLLTQSCTNRLTLGFSRRLRVFLEEGLEVMIMEGPAGSWERVALVDVGRELGGR